MLSAGTGLEKQLDKVGLTTKDVLGGVLQAAGAGLTAAMTADQANAANEAKYQKGPNRSAAQKAMAQDVYSNIGSAVARPPIVNRPLPQYTAPIAGTLAMPYNTGAMPDLPKRRAY